MEMQMLSELRKMRASFWDDSDIVKNDLTYFLDALILNRCVVKQPHAKSYYFRTEYTTETALKKCIQEKKSQREFRIDGIITSMENVRRVCHTYSGCRVIQNVERFFMASIS